MESGIAFVYLRYKHALHPRERGQSLVSAECRDVSIVTGLIISLETPFSVKLFGPDSFVVLTTNVTACLIAS